MLSLKKKTLACAVMGASPLAPGIIGQAVVVPPTQAPDQDEHHTGFINTSRCGSVRGTRRHPQEQRITDKRDRYNGTNSFTNRTDRPIQYTLKVTGGINGSVKATSSGNMWDVFLRGVKNKYGTVKINQWSAGDKLDPVTVNPGETVRANYGMYMESLIGHVRTCDQKTGL